MQSTLLTTKTTAFNEVEINQVGKRIDMDVAGATFATWHPTHYLTGYSWDAVTAGCLLFPDSAPGSILLLGLAGGTVARQLRLLLPDVQLAAVEIDPQLVQLAEQFMELQEANVTVEIADAYRWLEQTNQRFDVIIDDIYLSGKIDVERPVSPTGDTLELLASRLTPAGIVVANMITDGLHHALYQQTRSDFVARFDAFAEIPAPKGYNHILVGGPALASAARLDEYRDRFPTRRDRDWWDRMNVFG